jgi:hypothetical protein
MMRSMQLGASLATASAEERAARTAEMQRLRARGAVRGRVVAFLLLFALAAMAVARYLQTGGVSFSSIWLSRQPHCFRHQLGARTYEQ